MPYSSNAELPSEVKKRYTDKQLRAYRKAFNDAIKDNDESSAHQIAHRAAQRAGDRDATQNAKAAKRAREGSAVDEALARVRRDFRLPDFPVEEARETVAEPEVPPSTDVQRAFLVESHGRTILTAPATAELEKAWSPNPYFLHIKGAFVGAERANRNGALWTLEDLEMGEPTVKHGPLNWLHEERKIVGTLAEAAMVHPSADLQTEAAAATEPFIAAASVVWRWLWPDEAMVIQQAASQERLWYSMECVSEKVVCADHDCGEFSYMDAHRAMACEHINERTGTRRFKNPSFLGGAVIVPPVRPGWPGAHASLMQRAEAQAERAFEQAGRPDVRASDWELLMAQVLEFAEASG